MWILFVHKMDKNIACTFNFCMAREGKSLPSISSIFHTRAPMSALWTNKMIQSDLATKMGRRGRLTNVLLPTTAIVLALVLRIFYMCIVLTSVGYRYAEDNLSSPHDMHHDSFLPSEPSILDEPRIHLVREPNDPAIQPIRFLWGIMTTDSSYDRKHRKVIRSTYLSYYKSDEENKH
jgi:hypothetical protein